MARRTSALVGVALFALACEEIPFREVEVKFDTTPALLPAPTPQPSKSRPVLRFSVAGMESPSDTYLDYSRLFDAVAQRLGAEADFVQRRTYAEINQLLVDGKLDAALLCTGGYLDLKRRAPGAVEVVGVPLVDGSDTYHSLVVVPVTSPARTLADLEGARFAFTDELSLTGRAWVLHELRARGRTADGFFRSTVFTRSHDRSLTAVTRGVVDGAAVHSVVFQHLVEKDPSLLRQVRVIQRSPAFGLTPLVVSTRLPPDARARLRDVLLGLAADPQGATLLGPLRIDSFAPAAPGHFDSAFVVVQGPP